MFCTLNEVSNILLAVSQLCATDTGGIARCPVVVREKPGQGFVGPAGFFVVPLLKVVVRALDKIAFLFAHRVGQFHGALKEGLRLLLRTLPLVEQGPKDE